jgi:hypothetical protein
VELVSGFRRSLLQSSGTTLVSFLLRLMCISSYLSFLHSYSITFSFNLATRSFILGLD